MTASPRVSGSALLALLLGLASLLVLAVSGIPALVIGLRSLRRINLSDGRLRGRWLAVGGMVLGGLGTLVTLVGVVGIIVVQVQVSSRNLQSIDHLRRIGAALNKHCDVKGAYPPATHEPEALPPGQRLSWMADILPMLPTAGTPSGPLDQVVKAIDRSKGWDDPANKRVLNTPIRLFLAPGHPRDSSREIRAETDYVGCAGIGPKAAYLPRTDPRAGMFGHDRGVVRGELERGASFTFMALETAYENGPWLAGGHPTVRSVPPQGEHLSGPDKPFGGISPSRVQVLWVDGSVRALTDSTPGAIFRSHATLHAP